MKIIVLLLSCFLLSVCLKKVDSIDKRTEIGKYGVLDKKTFIPEIQKPDASYVFDIDSFNYLDEFPRTITGNEKKVNRQMNWHYILYE